MAGYYLCLLRPPSLGAIPKDAEIIETYETRQPAPGDEDGPACWAVIRFDRAVTWQELDRFDLTPYNHLERGIYNGIRQLGEDTARALLGLKCTDQTVGEKADVQA